HRFRPGRGVLPGPAHRAPRRRFDQHGHPVRIEDEAAWGVDLLPGRRPRHIGDPSEWGRFPDWGTTIIEGIDQATQLFRTFDFTNASGNLMIVFTDGRDSQLNQQRADLDRVVAEARTWKIPVYMMRTAYNRRDGE